MTKKEMFYSEFNKYKDTSDFIPVDSVYDIDIIADWLEEHDVVYDVSIINSNDWMYSIGYRYIIYPVWDYFTN